MTFRALEVREESEGQFTSSIIDKRVDDLPAGDLLIKVHYSSLNYKDALSASGNRGVTRRYPHTPGIDASGVVAESTDPRFQVGEKVLVTGYDLGMNTPGGLAEYIRIPSAWAVKLPEGLSLMESMIFGTAGLTAALSVYQLNKHGLEPGAGPVLVTGASGGVGSLAVAILHRIGYKVTALSGKEEAGGFLQNLGATELISREAMDDMSGKPLLKPLFAGVVDTVGGNILSTALKSLHYNGVATCCGLVKSTELHTTIFPFILKGVSLIGIDSVQCAHPLRTEIWSLLAGSLKPANLHDLASECSLDEADAQLKKMLEGHSQGRYVVKIGS